MHKNHNLMQETLCSSSTVESVRPSSSEPSQCTSVAGSFPDPQCDPSWRSLCVMFDQSEYIKAWPFQYNWWQCRRATVAQHSQQALVSSDFGIELLLAPLLASLLPSLLIHNVCFLRNPGCG